MPQIHYKQLDVQLQKKLYTVYILYGNDTFLLQESYDVICKTAAIRGFNERYSFQIDKHINWKTVFLLCKTISLFSTRRIIQLLLPENGPDSLSSNKLITLANLLHNDLLLIIRGNKLTATQKNTPWFISLSSYSVQVSCFTPEQTDLSAWIAARAKNNNLNLDDAACKLLCAFYEGNLAGLSQILEKLSILWPNGKLTAQHIKQIVNNSACFTPMHWIEAIFIANSKRALHILQKLRVENNEHAMFLLRILQRELFLLINLKRQSVHVPLSVLLKKYCFWNDRRSILETRLNQIHESQLRYIVHILSRIESVLKDNENKNQLLWIELESISLLLTHQIFTNMLTN